MNRFEQKPTPLVYAATVVSMVAVLIADWYAPLGIAVWVIYLLPVALSLFAWRPVTPLVVALLATLLTVIGYTISSPGVDPGVARINRGFGILTIWAVAAISYQFIRNKLIVRRQAWLQSGETQLSETMEGEQTLPELGENILRILSQYLDGHAGAFFVEEGGSFRRFATYAVPAQNSVPERFMPGEGLLGQAAKDKRTVLVHDVPEGYFTIASALGRSRARHLSIAPASADENVNAVLEIAFMHPVYGSDIELLDRVAKSIGRGVRSAQYRTRQQELLEQTGRQSKELQAQSDELRIANQELARQSQTKEVLLKEIHHRVKNNMQVISSLMDLQADRTQDEAVRAVLQDVMHRVRAMALVHESLYRSADMARVEFAEYAQSLLGYLWRAHDTTSSGIRLTLDLEPVPLSVNVAVPCGLILNELATNALKHAFRGRAPSGCGGEVTVSLHGEDEGRVCLRVRDNGVGLPPGLDWRQADSLGLRVVQLLAKQLDATVEVCSGEGTEFAITFGERKTLEHRQP